MNNLDFKKIHKEFKKYRGDVPTTFTKFSDVCKYVTEFMFDKYPDIGDDPSYINCGYCFIWAYLVWVLWPNKDEISFATSTGHVVVKYNNKFYDSEHLCGESHLSDIELMVCRNPVVTVGCNWMYWFWARNGNARVKFRALINKFDKAAYQYIRKGPGWSYRDLEHWSAEDELEQFCDILA